MPRRKGKKKYYVLKGSKTKKGPKIKKVYYYKPGPVISKSRKKKKR